MPFRASFKRCAMTTTSSTPASEFEASATTASLATGSLATGSAAGAACAGAKTPDKYSIETIASAWRVANLTKYDIDPALLVYHARPQQTAAEMNLKENQRVTGGARERKARWVLD